VFEPFTSEAKASLEHAGREARSLGDGTVGTEHVLLGVLRAGEARTLDALARAGIEREALRKRVRELFAGDDASS